MRINKFIKNNFKYGIINLTAGKNDYHFRYDSSKKLWNCYIYDSKELEIARQRMIEVKSNAQTF